MSFPLLAVVGPTASGKTRLGVALARRFGGEILSADSRQVYRGLTIGTGKDLAEYGTGAERVSLHLVDIADPTEEVNLYRWQAACYDAIEKVRARGALPVLVGGTGLYLEAVLRGYELPPAPPDQALRGELEGLAFEELVERLRQMQGGQLHATADLEDRERVIRAIEVAAAALSGAPVCPRPPIRPYVLGVRWPVAELDERIRLRLAARLEQGLIEEVARLRSGGLPDRRLHQLGLEYRFVAAFLRGEIPSREALFERLALAIRRFAKRQRTWFRGMERRGVPIDWIDRADEAAALDRGRWQLSQFFPEGHFGCENRS